VVEEYFPLDTEKSRTPTAPQCAEAEPLPTIPQNPNEDSLSPGEAYRVYDSHDILGSVPEEYRVVVGRAAGSTGVEEEYMFTVVERYERRFIRWWKTKQRREEERQSETGSET
jgi:RNA polymerase I-specific transcription initiation factor RRN7